MDIKRVILYSALAITIYSLWTNWQREFPSVTVPQKAIESADNYAPPSAAIKQDIAPTHHAGVQTSSGKTIEVATDVLDLNIDLQHGDVIKAEFPKYPESLKDKNKPFTLLQSDDFSRYVANSSLFQIKNGQSETLVVNYTTDNDSFKLSPGQDSLNVILTGKTENNLHIEKIFKFKRDSYLIDVEYKITNDGNATWIGYVNNQLVRVNPKEEKGSMFNISSYTGASYANPGITKYKKVSFSDMSKGNLNVYDVHGGWIAMQQHYFLSAWVPNADNNGHLYTRTNNNRYAIGILSSPLTLGANHTKTVSSQLYVGPENSDVLKGIAPGLDLTIDYGILWFFSSLLFSLMRTIYSVVGNWGWSIVLVTVLVKLAFYRLSATSYKSMANMRKLQPKLQALRERYGDDKAKLSQATMEIYRSEKVNPLGGCLPIVVQIPVFIALYWVLIESVELRQAPFIFWIKDLAAPDPYHILPIIMGLTMLIQQRLNPAPPDPTQAKIMMFLPVMFTALFWNFPSGLVLYWVVNNSLSILQQWYITRKYGGDTNPPKKLAAANK